MALINCPECNKEISDKAVACPSCGFPLPKPVAADIFTCRQCGKDFPFNMDNCPHCGFCNAQQYKFKPTPTPEPSKEIEEAIICLKCKAKNSFATGNKGFGLGKAAVGGLLLGPVGLLGGVIGSKKTVITCLKCGHKWNT